jgi:F-type H+-transporting ATPase subunit epsilon
MADETNQLRVRLVTPERIFFDHAAAAVELPAKNGCMEVLYGHAPLVAELGAGDVIVHGGTDSKAGGEAGGPASVARYNVSWGFAEVLGDRVTILAADAIKPEEIDVSRAKDQLARGHKEWDQAGDREEAYTEALRVIAEAEAKIASAAEKH